MVLFGREIWLRHGEVFSLVFGLLSRFAPTELRVNGKSVCATCSSSMCNDGEEDCINCTECFRRASAATREWNLRPFGVGLLTVRSVSFSLTFFVVLMLATVTFDGFMATLYGQKRCSGLCIFSHYDHCWLLCNPCLVML